MDDAILATILEAAVPLHIADVQDLPYLERQRIVQETADIIGSQGDTLQYGSRLKFGHGARETAAHEAAGKCPGTGEHCACDRNNDPDARQSCMRCANPKCFCHIRGEASYSAGEIFNFLAGGLAVLACQPGGVTFAGLHWCAAHMKEPWPDGVLICPACLREERTAAAPTDDGRGDPEWEIR